MPTTTVEFANDVYKITYTEQRYDSEYGEMSKSEVFLAEYIKNQRGEITGGLIVLRESDGKNIGYGSGPSTLSDGPMFTIILDAVREYDRRNKLAISRAAYDALHAKFLKK